MHELIRPGKPFKKGCTFFFQNSYEIVFGIANKILVDTRTFRLPFLLTMLLKVSNVVTELLFAKSREQI